jgi:hypothetical protein
MTDIQYTAPQRKTKLKSTLSTKKKIKNFLPLKKRILYQKKYFLKLRIWPNQKTDISAKALPGLANYTVI